MKIDLKKPLSYKDTDIETLELDLESLTGRSLIDAENSLKAKGQNISAWEFSRGFLLEVAGKASNIPPEALMNLTAADFTNVINEVLAFLAGQGFSASRE